MFTIIITLSGLLVAAVISNIIFALLLKKSLKSQSYYYQLFRREQKDCLQADMEKRTLETEMKKMTDEIVSLKNNMKHKLGTHNR